MKTEKAGKKETVTVWQTIESYLLIKFTSQRMLENVWNVRKRFQNICFLLSLERSPISQEHI